MYLVIVLAQRLKGLDGSSSMFGIQERIESVRVAAGRSHALASLPVADLQYRRTSTDDICLLLF
jgi:hypothetical protein